MPETKTTDRPAPTKISVASNAEGDVVLTLPRSAFYEAESLAEDGVVRLYLDEDQTEVLQKEISAHMLETLIVKAEGKLQKLPRESIRRDLGRAGVKVLRRIQQARKSKQDAEAIVEHVTEVVGPWLDKFSFGK